MKQDYKDSLTLSSRISKYPLVATALACLLCLCFEQKHQASRYTMAGINGQFGFVSVLPAVVLTALTLSVFIGFLRESNEGKAKTALYIGGGFAAAFLCWRGLLLLSEIWFDLCMLLMGVAAIALCLYFYIKKRFLSTALCAVAVLALCLAFGFGILICVIGALVFALTILSDTEISLIRRCVATAVMALTAVTVPMVYSEAAEAAGGVFSAGVLLCVGGCLVALIRGRDRVTSIIALMFGLGLVMRLGYVFDVALPSNQHDVFSVFTPEYPRHNTYIMHIYNNWSLPTENVYNAGLSQYYHPPLYHFIAALWMKAQTLCGIELYAAYENIQYFTMFCSAAMMTVAYKLFCEFKLKGVALCTAFAVIAFHPTFYIFAGSVNNDPLTTLFIFLAILYTVRWYKTPSYKNTLLLAVSIGGAMMTKLSGAMVAVGTAYVMLAKLFDTKTGGFFENLKSLWKRFLAFGAVCFPMGLWWPIRCYVLYGMPLGYVPALSVNNVQYLGEYSIFERLTGIGSLSFSNMYPNVGGTTVDGGFLTGDNSGFFDYGIGPYIVKSSLFGEYFMKTKVGGFQNLLAYVMVFSAIALIGISLYAIIKCTISADGKYKVPIRFMAVYYLVLLGSYILFCFGYPHTCTMDFRYIVPTLLIGAVFTGIYLNTEGKRVIKTTTLALTVLFSLSSGVFYLLSY